MHKIMRYLEDNGLATREELARHCGVPPGLITRTVCMYQAPGSGYPPVIERVYSLTKEGQQIARRRGAQ